MSQGKIRVGIVGAGQVATYAHAPGFREAGAEVMAVADVVEGRAARFASKSEIPHAFASYQEMFALPELDAISVCAPAFAHEEIAVAAFEAGKHVYMEKPPAMNEAEMIRIVAAGRKAGKLLMVGSNQVYWNWMQILKRYIDAGELGEIYLFKVLGAGRRGIPRGWFRQKRFGGGARMDGGSHFIDRALFLLSTPKPISVVARTYSKFATYFPRQGEGGYEAIAITEGTETDVPVMDVDDAAVAFVQFDTGCTLIFEVTWAANTSGGAGTWIYGTKAGASWQGSEGLTIYGETAGGITTDTKPVFRRGAQTHVEAFRHFLECIREGKETQSAGERAIVTMRILDAIYESEASGGREVRLG